MEISLPLCVSLAEINDSMSNGPCAATFLRALTFLRDYESALANSFSMCAWTFAMCQHTPMPAIPGGEPNPTWDEAYTEVVSSLELALAVLTQESWLSAHRTWEKFYLSVSTGCCAKLPNGDVGSRFVIRPGPPTPPFNGQLFCVPTLTPALLTERSYATRQECDLALSFLPRGNVAQTDKVYCNEYGCSRVPQWSNIPQYSLDLPCPR